MKVEARNITKTFSGITALSNISLALHPGKVNAIIGENGAGKSTLMKIFSGVITNYDGEILLNDVVQHFNNTKDAEQAGIAIIHQELNLVPHMTVAENIFLGKEYVTSIGVLDKKRMLEETASILKYLNISIQPDEKIETLKIGQQQLVEIAKALHGNADVIIMDEPTSALSDKEVETLFVIISQLKEKGKTIVYISHKLKELFALADYYIILRDGQSIDAGLMQQVNQDELIQKMTGRNLQFKKSGHSNSSTEVLMTVKNLSLKHPVFRSLKIVNKVSFDLYRGEIVGVYGLMGAGRTEMLEALFGLHPPRTTGTIHIDSKVVSFLSPQAAIAHGMALVPEDRKLNGLILDQSVGKNISLTILKSLEKWGLWIGEKKENTLIKKYIERLGIKAASQHSTARSLSGGNQQKIVLAKWLATTPAILLLDEPTRGIDVKAKAEIYSLMKTLAAQGMGIIMVSSELPEIVSISDRVLVMCEGELTATIPIENATESLILKHALQKNDTAA